MAIKKDQVTAELKSHLKLTLLVILLIIAAALWIKHLSTPIIKPKVGETVIATAAKEVKSIPKHRATVKNASVSVYESPAKVKLDLPAAVIDNDQKQVIASTTVSGDDHPQTTTTTINLDTGEFETYTRKDPLPWLAWDDHGSAGMYAGIRNGTPTARLEIKQQIFSIKAVHFGAVATLDQPISGSVSMRPDYFVGVGVEYKW